MKDLYRIIHHNTGPVPLQQKPAIRKTQENKSSSPGANSLKEAEIETVADLVRLQKTDLLKYKNFSKRAIVELSEWLEQHGLSFGMNV